MSSGSLLQRAVQRLRPRPVPRHAGFRTTPEGKVFLLAVCLVGFTAQSTGANLLYLISSVMGSLLVVSVALSVLALRGLRAERLVPTHITTGEEASIPITLRSDRRWLAAPTLRVADVLDTGEAMGLAPVIGVPARGVAHVGLRMTFPRRGAYRFDHLMLMTRHPFGFLEWSRALPAPQEVLALPRVVDLSADLSESQLQLGEIERGRRGPGSSLHGLRAYTQGDSARDIHWRVSAKAREVVVREFEQEEKKRVTLFLANAAPRALSDIFERAVVFTASLSKFLIDRDYQVQLLTLQGRVPFGAGAAHLHRLLRSLAIIELLGEERSAPLATHAAADSVSIIVHFRDTPPPVGHGQVHDVTQWRCEAMG